MNKLRVLPSQLDKPFQMFCLQIFLCIYSIISRAIRPSTKIAADGQFQFILATSNKTSNKNSAKLIR